MPLTSSGAWLTNTIQLAAVVHSPRAATFQSGWQFPAGTLRRMLCTGAFAAVSS